MKYTANRADVWRAYWQTWRHSRRLNFLRLVFVALTFMAAQSWFADASMTERLSGAFIFAVATMLLVSAYPVLRFKPEERMLVISPSGLSTTSGKWTGYVLWTDVSHIAASPRCIYIIGKNGNAFTIPTHAFSADADRVEFLDRATTWWNGGRQRGPAPS